MKNYLLLTLEILLFASQGKRWERREPTPRSLKPTEPNQKNHSLPGLYKWRRKAALKMPI